MDFFNKRVQDMSIKRLLLVKIYHIIYIFALITLKNNIINITNPL